MSKDLNPEKALIFRIVHRDAMADVWSGGCHCKNDTVGRKYTQIGNLELISKRDSRVVPCPPGGTLSDYVPFCFTPFTADAAQYQDRVCGRPEKTHGGDRPDLIKSNSKLNSSHKVFQSH
jgi:hypothetical protein